MNYGHDHTRQICLIFYQLLPTTSVGNELGQSMRIQILILGLKVLTVTLVPFFYTNLLFLHFHQLALHLDPFLF